MANPGAPITGSFTATGTDGKMFQPVMRSRDFGDFNIWISGTAVATVQLEVSPDNGTTWYACYGGGTKLYNWPYSNSGTGDNINEACTAPRPGMFYRLNVTAYTSGTLSYRLDQ